MKRPVLALLLSIPLVASGTAGLVLHLCQSMGGLVLGGCGCDESALHAEHSGHGEGSHEHAHEAGPTLQQQPCCTVQLSQASPALATQQPVWQEVEQASLALAGLHFDHAASSRETCGPGLLRERAPPNVHGPPIFVRNCSFLN
jgi:hypothetical protein